MSFIDGKSNSLYFVYRVFELMMDVQEYGFINTKVRVSGVEYIPTSDISTDGGVQEVTLTCALHLHCYFTRYRAGQVVSGQTFHVDNLHSNGYTTFVIPVEKKLWLSVCVHWHTLGFACLDMPFICSILIKSYPALSRANFLFDFLFSFMCSI